MAGTTLSRYPLVTLTRPWMMLRSTQRPSGRNGRRLRAARNTLSGSKKAKLRSKGRGSPEKPSIKRWSGKSKHTKRKSPRIKNSWGLVSIPSPLSSCPLSLPRNLPTKDTSTLFSILPKMKIGSSAQACSLLAKANGSSYVMPIATQTFSASTG